MPPNRPDSRTDKSDSGPHPGSATCAAQETRGETRSGIVRPGEACLCDGGQRVRRRQGPVRGPKPGGTRTSATFQLPALLARRACRQAPISGRHPDQSPVVLAVHGPSVRHFGRTHADKGVHRSATRSEDAGSRAHALLQRSRLAKTQRPSQGENRRSTSAIPLSPGIDACWQSEPPDPGNRRAQGHAHIHGAGRCHPDADGGSTLADIEVFTQAPRRISTSAPPLVASAARCSRSGGPAALRQWWADQLCLVLGLITEAR